MDVRLWPNLDVTNLIQVTYNKRKQSEKILAALPIFRCCER